MSDHDDAKLLRAALEHWVATRDALLGVYALPLTADEHQRPGVEYVRDRIVALLEKMADRLDRRSSMVMDMLARRGIEGGARYLLDAVELIKGGDGG